MAASEERREEEPQNDTLTAEESSAKALEDTILAFQRNQMTVLDVLARMGMSFRHIVECQETQ